MEIQAWGSHCGDLAKPKLNRWPQFIEYNTGTKPPKGRRELKYKFTKNNNNNNNKYETYIAHIQYEYFHMRITYD